MALNNHVEKFTLDMAPGGIAPVLNVSQGDIGRKFTADIFWGGSSYDVSGLTAKVRGRKRDNTVFEYVASLSGTTATFETKKQMTIIPGNVDCEIVFFDSSSHEVGTANFTMIVEEAPYDPDAPSQSVIPGIEDLIEQTIGGDVRDETDAWLDAHPEATTTIQDGAITKAKINTAFLPEIKNAYVTPEMFGAVGDGTTNDTAAFQDFLHFCYENKVPGVLLEKTYLVDPLVFNYETFVEGFTLIGCSKMNSILKLSEPGWFANVGNRNLINKWVFKNIRFTGPSGHGYGFYMWSNGDSKQLRCYDCYFYLDGLLRTEGTGNADINTFINCSGYLNEYVMYLNNQQSVSTNFVQCSFACYGDMFKVDAGGCTNVYGGAFDFLGTNPGFVVNASDCAGLGLGNLDYNFVGARFEIHNAGQGAFAGKDNAPIKVSFIQCNFGAIQVSAPDFCTVLAGNIVSFNDCTIGDNAQYKAESTTSRGVGALLKILDSCVGRSSQLSTRATRTGSTARIIAKGNYLASSDIGIDSQRPNDFDYGWENDKNRSALTAAEKVLAVKVEGAAWPFTNGSNNIKVYPPIGCTLTEIGINIPANSSAGVNATLTISNNDGSVIYYQSSPFLFTSGFKDRVQLQEKIIDNLLITLTNTQGTVFYYSGGYAYIKYI